MITNSKYPSVTVIICTLNGNDNISKPLESLKRQTYPLDKISIIIVDDGSARPIKIPKTNSSELSIEILRNKKNRGLGFSRYIAVLKSKGQFVAFTDDDCSPDPNWVCDLVNGFKEFPSVSALGGKIISSELSNIWQLYTEKAKLSFFNHIALDDRITPRSYFKRFFGRKKYEFSHGQRLISCMGLNSAYRGDVIRKFKPNPCLRRGVDLELNLRLIEENSKIIYIDKMIVAHPHRKSFFSFAKHNFEYGLNTVNCFKGFKRRILPYPFPLIGFMMWIILSLINFLELGATIDLSTFLLLPFNLSIFLGIIIAIYYVADLHYAFNYKNLISSRIQIFLFPFAHFIRDLFWDIGWFIGNFSRQIQNKKRTE